MGGPWTPEEEFHINYLELLVAFLAIQAFVRDKTPDSIHPTGMGIRSDLHLQEGRLSFSTSDTTGQESMGMVHGGEDHPVASQNPTGSPDFW